MVEFGKCICCFKLYEGERSEPNKTLTYTNSNGAIWSIYDKYFILFDSEKRRGEGSGPPGSLDPPMMQQDICHTDVH
jgi:hypothetical protein